MKKFINKHAEENFINRNKIRDEDIRGPYFRDQTAIIHSMAFRRLKHKTQVFFSPDNDHICTRIEHSLHVASIASTICKALGLDNELAHAIGLGHDLGHAPFGHAGEKAINKLIKHQFNHELHSLRVVDKLENRGEGLNLTYAVRDGIVSHCGEIDEQFITISEKPNKLEDLTSLPKSPSSWEGCIVRICDSVAYLGRDLEDAITARLISIDDIPKTITDNLGTTNSEIISSLVFDIIDWSEKNNKIGFSENIFQVVSALKNFSRKKIYKNDKMNYWNKYSEFVIKTLFEYLIDLIEKNGLDFSFYSKNRMSFVQKFGKYIDSLQKRYKLENFNHEVIITDYLAGMTDAYAINSFKNILTSGTSGF